MRNTTFITLLIAGCTTLAQAQTLIPKVGVTISSLAAETRVDGDGITSTTDYGNQTGFTLGVGYNVPVTAFGSIMLSLQPEFNYIQKGYTAHTEGEYSVGEAYYQVTGKSKFTLNYVEIPVLTKFECGMGNIKVALYVGPSLGFAFGGKYKTTIVSTEDGGEAVNQSFKGKVRFYDSDEPNETSLDHNVDFGLQGGAAVTLLNRVTVDVRYGAALTNLVHDDKTKNKVIQFTVGMPISLR